MDKIWRSLFVLILLLAACNLPAPETTPAIVPTSTTLPTAALKPTTIPTTPPTAATAPTKAAAVSNLWHVSYPSNGAKPLLLAARLDVQNRLLGLSEPVDLPLMEQSYIGPRLYMLSAAPPRTDGAAPPRTDGAAPAGQQALAGLISRDVVQYYLVDLGAGKAKTLPGLSRYAFMGWHPDGKRVLALGVPVEQIPRLVDLDSGKSSEIALPDAGGFLPSANALAFSLDGATLADALYYSRAVNRPAAMLEIGLRPAGNLGLEGRKVLCTRKNDVYVNSHSLRWSPDGRFLIWVEVSETPLPTPAPSVKPTPTYAPPPHRAELWLAEVASGKCRSLAILSDGPQYNIFPAWSPDGSRIAAVHSLPTAEPEGARDEVLLIDPLGARSEVLVSADALPVPPIASGNSPSALLPVYGITSLQWSPDGRYLALALGRGTFGDIRAVEVSSRKLTQLAGPTPPLAPFAWK